MSTMTTRSRTRVVPPGHVATVLLPVKVRPDLRRRFKVAAAEEGQTYAELIETFLDQRDARLERQRRAQAHPLHQPGPTSHYPGGSHR